MFGRERLNRRHLIDQDSARLEQIKRHAIRTGQVSTRLFACLFVGDDLSGLDSFIKRCAFKPPDRGWYGGRARRSLSFHPSLSVDGHVFRVTSQNQVIEGYDVNEQEDHLNAYGFITGVVHYVLPDGMFIPVSADSMLMEIWGYQGDTDHIRGRINKLRASFVQCRHADSPFVLDCIGLLASIRDVDPRTLLNPASPIRLPASMREDRRFRSVDRIIPDDQPMPRREDDF